MRVSTSIFRVARPASSAWNLLKTLAQSAILWSLALLAVPLLIVRIEQHFGMPEIDFAHRSVVGWTILIAMSMVNLWSGATMAHVGAGTPLPLDCPRALVVRGPYRYLRNPMAVAGLGQGVGVGLLLGSWTVVLYALAGGVLWQTLARPAEEADLERRFGTPYARYRRAVRCWWPRWTPYDGATETTTGSGG